jgi:hypothetical protein
MKIELDNPQVLIDAIKEASVVIKQEDIDFYRPWANKLVIED